MAKTLEVIPDSPSLILRATHILSIEIQARREGEWQPAPQGGVYRQSTLTIALLEVLKGTTTEGADTVIEVQITQYGTGTSRIAAVPGVWSYQPTDPGTRMIAFSVSADNSAAILLTDPACQRLALAEDSLDEVRLSLEAEREEFTSAALMQRAEPLLAHLGDLFSTYLWARYGSEVMANTENLEAFLAFLRQPELAQVARVTLLNEVYSYLVAIRTSAPEQAGSLARTLFLLLDIPEVGRIRDNIVDVFLPNLLGLSPGMTVLPAEYVFGAQAGEKDAARQYLQAIGRQSSTAALMGWLDTPGQE